MAQNFSLVKFQETVCIMKFMPRTYRQQQRAEDQARTRARIVEATVSLHQEKGVAATSVADIATRAGVGKVTVYRHFPDLTALVGACSGQYFECHPLPDLQAWRAIADPVERLHHGLAVTCAYHRKTAAMMASVLPDLRGSPLIAPYADHWLQAAQVLAETWPAAARDNALLLSALALALDFGTWHLLAIEQQLDDGQIVRLLMRLVLPVP